jgi:hypothetical protein
LFEAFELVFAVFHDTIGIRDEENQLEMPPVARNPVFEEFLGVGIALHLGLRQDDDIGVGPASFSQ